MILITGAAKRLGQAIALHLAKKEPILVHYNQSKEDAIQLQSSIRNNGGTCDIIHADLNQPNTIPQFMDDIYAMTPTLNTIIHNASVFDPGDLLDTDYTLLKRQFDVNTFSPMLMCIEFAKRQRDGHIINILDTQIQRNPTNRFAYLMSKKSFADFTQMAAKSLAPGIRVNGIMPGWILDPVDTVLSDQDRYDRAQAIPLKKGGSPKDICHAIDYLMSAEFVTGEQLDVSGGCCL